MYYKTIFILGLLLAGPVLGAACEDSLSLSLGNTEITEAEQVNGGQYSPADLQTLNNLPAYCRIAAVLRPSPDSRIEMEIWLPQSGWNGKFLAVGNGGWAGSISFSAMAEGLRKGYAVASNDTGHQESSAAFAVGHPEKLVDFGYRAMHEMVVKSKLLIAHYYQSPPQLSYFQGCSTGGRQVLMEAQRYPNDFDGIIAGAPVNNMFLVSATQMESMVSMLKDRSLYLPPGKIQLLHHAVLAACEATDGVSDGFLSNPEACGFDPAVLQCTGADTSSCLTPGQLESVRRVYAPVTLSSGQEIYPGHAPGFELGWRMLEADAEPATLQSDTFKYVAHEDPDWQWQSFDLDTDTPLALSRAGDVHAVDPDLTEFMARGGKLLMYHGWNDPGPSPFNSIDYYNAVTETVESGRDDWLRMFMMPGMGHCRGGIGPDQTDFLGALEAWRESGITPDRILSRRISNGQVDMTRPLCPYPQTPLWTGQGSTDDADNFTCSAR